LLMAAYGTKRRIEPVPPESAHWGEADSDAALR
jgi:hypothetical protein